MTTATLGFAIDSSPAAKAASDLDGLVTAAGRTENAVEKMGSSVTRAVTRISGAGAQIKQQLGKVANDTENLAARIERALNIRTSFGGAERGKDIAAFGQELDRLRGKFNPVFNALSNYKAALGEIRQAHKLGAISSDEMTAAISRERQAALASVQALKGRQQAMGGMGGGNSGFRRQNLGYQAFDIGQGLAGGISPAMILAQQGPQIAQLYAGAGGAKAALSDVASLATGAVSAIGALPLALGAAGAAAILYAKRNEVSLKSADEALEKHRENIEALGTAYGVAEQRAKSYSGADRAVANAATQGSLENLNKLQVQSARELRQQFGSMQTPGRGGQAFFAPFPDYKPFADAFRDLDNGIRNGRVEGEKFIDAVSQIAKVNPEYDEFANKILKAAQQFLQINTEVSKTKDLLTQIGTLAPLDPLGAFNPQRQIDERAARTPSQTQQRQSRMDAYRQQTMARSAAEREAAARATAAAQFDPNENPTDRENRIAMAGYEARIAAERQLADAQRERAANLNKMLGDQQNEIDLIGKTGGAAAALRKEYELIAALKAEAARNGEQVDQAEIDAIKQKTAEYGKYVDLLNQRRFEFDFGKQVSDSRLSDRNRQIVTTLRQYGLSEDLNSPNAGMIGKQYDWQQAKDTAKSFGSAFSSELVSGSHDIGKSFAAGLKASLEKETEKLWERVFDNLGTLFANLVTGSKGGASGASSSVGAVAPAIFGGSGNGSGKVSRGSGGAVDKAFSLIGANENSNSGQINTFLKQGGVDIDAAQTAWCAAFVNSSLEQVGIKGTGSLTANSFQNWGSKIDPTKVLRGDVLLDTNGLGAGQAGGHVGLATGATRLFGGNQQLQMLSGNSADSVQTTWVNAFDIQARRATDAAGALDKLASSSGTATQGLGTLGNGLGSLGNSLSSAGSSAASGGGGGGGLFGWLGGLFGGGGQWAAAASGKITGLFADGTNYAPGGLAIVGERGPELVNLPQGSQVFNTNKSAQMMAANSNSGPSGGGMMNVNIQGANGDDHVRTLVQQGVGEALREYNEQQRRGGFGQLQTRFTSQKG
ncbi:phage tail length tape measure family protein [Rhizobium mongolense]|uniref:phage tail length tape measure family protein n=1 Tax=Rhizobium mongolense TaxID=57676 RepID=UPI0034A44494